MPEQVDERGRVPGLGPAGHRVGDGRPVVALVAGDELRQPQVGLLGRERVEASRIAARLVAKP
jgi:hypothetical protein